MVRAPRFEPGSSAWQADVLDQTRLRPQDTGLCPKSRELIINTLLYLKTNGRSEFTIKSTSQRLTHLAKICNLAEPTEVKLAIANMTTSNTDKQNYVNRYSALCTANKIEWKRPYYPSTRTPPKIPTREAVMKIITESRSNAPVYKTLMETGLMPYELSKVSKEDINFETRTLTAKGFKGHLGRTFKLTEETTAMLGNYFAKHTKIPTSKALGHSWIRAKNRVAERLQEPSIKTIRLYDLRHYYATMLYAKTDKIMLVKQQLGHRKIETTMIYTQLINFNEDEEYNCTATKEATEAKKLVEHGWQYVNSTPDGFMLYRKRK